MTKYQAGLGLWMRLLQCGNTCTCTCKCPIELNRFLSLQIQALKIVPYSVIVVVHLVMLVREQSQHEAHSPATAPVRLFIFALSTKIWDDEGLVKTLQCHELACQQSIIYGAGNDNISK